jgi:predicted DNA-binding transcriptional regulator AlpA
MQIYSIKLTGGDLRNAFETPVNPYGPVLSLKEAASLSKLAPSTLKRLVSEGKFENSVKRGKPLLFWRDRFVSELMK